MAAESEFLDQLNLFCNQVSEKLDVPIYLPQLLVAQVQQFQLLQELLEQGRLRWVVGCPFQLLAKTAEILICDKGLDAHGHSIEWSPTLTNLSYKAA
jgi:hypothetical protein